MHIATSAKGAPPRGRFGYPPALATLAAAPRSGQGDLVRLARAIDQGKLRPVIDRSFPFEQTAEAIRYVEQGHPRGKVLVKVGEGGG